jgi:hypothetical protein
MSPEGRVTYRLGVTYRPCSALQTHSSGPAQPSIGMHRSHRLESASRPNRAAYTSLCAITTRARCGPSDEWLCARATWRRSSTTMPCSMTLALEMHGRRIQRLVCEPVGLPLTRRPRTSVADPAHGGRRGLGRGTQFVRSANVSPRLLRTNESPMRNIDLLTLRFEVSCSRRFARRRSMGAVAARLYLSGEPSPVWLGIRHPGGRVDMDITAAGETMVERPRRARWPWHRSTHAGGRGSRNRSSTG